MAQSKFSSSLKKTVAAAALSGLMVGTASYLTGCQEDHGGGGSRVSSTAADGKHACKGMNACKGQGGCKTGDQGCKGKNSCKGQGGCKTN